MGPRLDERAGIDKPAGGSLVPRVGILGYRFPGASLRGRGAGFERQGVFGLKPSLNDYPQKTTEHALFFS